MARQAASLTACGASKSGMPWPRFSASYWADNRVISRMTDSLKYCTRLASMGPGPSPLHPSCLHPHEVREQLGAFERQEALRVELHAVQRPLAVADAHDLALVGPGADDEVGVGERLALDDQAVVARRLERVGQPREDPLVVVVDRRRLAVHDAH